MFLRLVLCSLARTITTSKTSRSWFAVTPLPRRRLVLDSGSTDGTVKMANGGLLKAQPWRYMY